MTASRRQLLAAALALGAAAAFGSAQARPSRLKWTERRDLYPEGVASGDPTSDGVILWTRRPQQPGEAAPAVTVEVAEDETFRRVVAAAQAVLDADTDWTCRVLVGGLRAAHTYFYRFTDAAGNGSRIGRTRTAPTLIDTRPVNFTFVSCQNANQGAQNAWRKMIWEDEQASPLDQLDFVLHLGDFIYEIVWYPEDRPQGMYDRRLRDIVRYESGEKVSDFHIPTTLADYRAVYKAYLHDPDIQDARARWPFVAMWDNHEFSWRGYQSVQKFGASVRPAQTRKVAANQAWFEFQPARVSQPGASKLDRFVAPEVADAPIGPVDEHGLIQEPNNLAAIASLKAYRALRFGANVDLIITDQHSYRTDDPSDGPAADPFGSPDFPDVIPEEILAIFDGGRDYPGGAPATIPFGGKAIANPCKDRPQATLLGAEQKAWFLDRLAGSTATWKIWGNSQGTLDMRTDFQNLPPGKAASPWPGSGYASFGGGDPSGYVGERAQIYDFVRDRGITGFATVSGDRHSFWAGLASKALPPQPFEPVGVAFITGSISAPGLVEAYKHRPKTHPLHSLYSNPRNDAEPDPTVNMLIRHGVKSVLEYLATGDAEAARAKSNPDLSPHLSFIDMGGHGYVKVRVSREAFDTEFVCIPRPLERALTPDGGPVAYRVRHHASLWEKGQPPKLEQQIVEGQLDLSI
ncbi:alkaline phosphatase D [Caulobacter ginsengisoli]|uniref:Alkaline phosphatase D n=1 Tax=Caulobacter ginsengisoli TaxID=400775 RepID=A0ABU0IYB4_9CAUL|nr:alkaline phosphatase D family protein [Caulobacter ginsengisoli]MDQ0465947.1 alkaline phosphatase D [Caulobacter ginsengisoli]